LRNNRTEKGEERREKNVFVVEHVRVWSGDGATTSTGNRKEKWRRIDDSMFVSAEEESDGASHEDSAAEDAAMGYKPQANCVQSFASSSSGFYCNYSRRRFFCSRCSSASLCLATLTRYCVVVFMFLSFSVFFNPDNRYSLNILSYISCLHLKWNLHLCICFGLINSLSYGEHAL